MKTIKIFQLLLATGLVIFLASCSASRSYSNYPPRPDASFSLIVNPYPGIVVNRYNDGRYYYRSPQGYRYWRGYDNRYYLDRSYVGRNYSHHRDYNDWKRNGNYGGKHHRH